MSYLTDPGIWLNFIFGLTFMGLGIFLGSWPRRLFPLGPPTAFGWVLRTGYVVGSIVYLYGGAAFWMIYIRLRFAGNVGPYDLACALGILLAMPILFWKVAHWNSGTAHNDLRSGHLRN
jgi:hypothetical protein